MKIGDIVTTTYIQQIIGDAKFAYKAESGKQFVFVFLGAENKDGSNPMDIDKVLGALGWKKKEQK